MKTHKERVREYVSNVVDRYPEFKYIDEEYLYSNIFWPVLVEPPINLFKKEDVFYEQDINDFYKFQINSQRTKIFEIFYRAAFKKIIDLGLDYDDYDSGWRIIDDTTTILEALDIRDISLKLEEKELLYKDEDSYKRFFEIYSNFKYYPIIDDILFKFKVRGELIKHLPYIESINQAVNMYLDSEIYDKEVDRFFIIVLSDNYILRYIDDIAYPRFEGGAKTKFDESFLDFYVSKLDKERNLINSVFNPGEFYFKSFIKWFGFALFVYIIPYIIELYAPIFHIKNIDIGSTLNYSLAIMIIWVVLLIIVAIQDKKRRNKVSKLFDKHKSLDEILLKMNDFYSLVREDSPLPVSEIKKEYYKMRDLNILLPPAILSIIENLEARKVKYL